MSTSTPAGDSRARPQGAVPEPPSGTKTPLPDAEDADPSQTLFAELDALLARMLALPVSYREDPEGGRELPAPAEMPPLITIAEAMADPVPTYSTPLPPVTFADQRLPAQSDLGLQVSTPVPVPVPAPLERPATPPRQQPAAAVEPAAAPAQSLPPPPAASPWLRPLVWCNRTFDRCTAPLGCLGRWLRAPASRSLLGWTGLFLLAAACGLAVYDCFGWTW